MRDVPDTIGWDGLVIFARHLPDESATMRAVYEHDHEGMEKWGTRNTTNELLAELHDLINFRFVSKKDKAKLKPIDRPWEKTTRHYGKAISREEFDRLYLGT